MYTTAGVSGIGLGAAVLPASGFGAAFFVAVATMFIVGGLLLARFGRRRAAHK